MAGVIYRISGPVVYVEGLKDARMYDVVRVGNEKLVGEIIKLEKGRAIVQVYEDTTGVRPGEPVENTGNQLSVLLGPGLLGSIFDGIQRPLDRIKAASGDFIARGVEVEPLDTKKKWDFKPTVKKGAEVHQGDIIGTVEETSLITHKVLVPPGMEGSVDSIDSGKFTISDTVAVVKTKDGAKKEIKLAQRWPVRIARPVKNKLPPNILLITGQRVLDTLFPVAKGGTAAAPGPFGSGKCVTGDTPIMLGDGRLMTMEELYKDNLASGKLIIDGVEEHLSVERPLQLLSLKDSRIVQSLSTLLYKGKSDSVLKIKTRTGREAKVTPVHKLFKIDQSGAIIEVQAKDLKAGDFIASARKLRTSPQRTRLPMPDTPKRAHNHIGTPEFMTEELAEFLGYYVSEGYIRGTNTVVFTNSEELLLDRFVALAEQLFGLKGKKEYQDGKTPNVLLMSKMLADFLNALGCGKIANSKQMPSQLLSCDDRILSRFLTSYFIGDGSFCDGDIEFSTASRGLQLQLSYALSRFGVLHVLGERKINGVLYYRIFVRGIDNLTLLLGALQSDHRKVSAIRGYISSKHTEYSAIDIVPLSKDCIEELYRKYSSYSALLKAGVEIHNYIGNGERMGASTFRAFVQSLNVSSGNQMQRLAVHELADALDYIYCDEIVEVEEQKGPIDVYDVSLPDYGRNFVGGFGGLILHNTVIQHQLAKWSDTEIVVYVGCGERGNEMTEVLRTFPELKDPKTGKPLMDRTILIANTSNMPVAAREASIYTGMTLAEFYRDMGYNVALMADSTSRWAEAMREISGRLEEMPGEEGYPAYLGRKIAEFYERAGRVNVLNGSVGSITAIGAVSPPGGDTSEPVSQNTLRVTRVFWALDASLANARHFPSINWLNSYSLYMDDLKQWYQQNVSKEWMELYSQAMELLQKEAEIKEIVQLVGYDALPEKEKMVLDIAKVIREDYLQQSAFDEVDTYSSMNKQYLMMKSIMLLYEQERNAVERGVLVDALQGIPAKQKVARMKYTPEQNMNKYYDETKAAIDSIADITAEAK